MHGDNLWFQSFFNNSVFSTNVPCSLVIKTSILKPYNSVCIHSPSPRGHVAVPKKYWEQITFLPVRTKRRIFHTQWIGQHIKYFHLFICVCNRTISIIYSVSSCLRTRFTTAHLALHSLPPRTHVLSIIISVRRRFNIWNSKFWDWMCCVQLQFDLLIGQSICKQRSHVYVLSLMNKKYVFRQWIPRYRVWS